MILANIRSEGLERLILDDETLNVSFLLAQLYEVTTMENPN